LTHENNNHFNSIFKKDINEIKPINIEFVSTTREQRKIILSQKLIEWREMEELEPDDEHLNLSPGIKRTRLDDEWILNGDE
jgi:phage-related protein